MFFFLKTLYLNYLADLNTGQSIIIAKQSDAKFQPGDQVSLLVYDSPSSLLRVFLTCSRTGPETIHSSQDGPTSYNIYLQSRCCCAGQCHYSPESNSLSGGAVFIIILVVVLVVYIVGGVLFLRFARGASGKDLIPNRMLWSATQSYAADGLRYSFQVIRQGSLHVDYQKV